VVVLDDDDVVSEPYEESLVEDEDDEEEEDAPPLPPASETSQLRNAWRRENALLLKRSMAHSDHATCEAEMQAMTAAEQQGMPPHSTRRFLAARARMVAAAAAPPMGACENSDCEVTSKPADSLYHFGEGRARQCRACVDAELRNQSGEIAEQLLGNYNVFDPDEGTARKLPKSVASEHVRALVEMLELDAPMLRAGFLPGAAPGDHPTQAQVSAFAADLRKLQVIAPKPLASDDEEFSAHIGDEDDSSSSSSSSSSSERVRLKNKKRTREQVSSAAPVPPPAAGGRDQGGYAGVSQDALCEMLKYVAAHPGTDAARDLLSAVCQKDMDRAAELYLAAIPADADDDDDDAATKRARPMVTMYQISRGLKGSSKGTPQAKLFATLDEANADVLRQSTKGPLGDIFAYTVTPVLVAQ
jgi:hypothetical protein